MKKRLLAGLLVVAGVAGAGGWWWVSHGKSGSSSALVLYGNVDIREVRLAFNGSEHVAEILVQEGDRVKAGQLLAKLHTDRLKASWNRAQADVVAAEAEAKAAQLTYQRLKSLSEKKLASQQDTDVAEGKARAATARVTATKAALAEIGQALIDSELRAPVTGVVRERIVEVGDFVNPQTPVLTLSLLDPVWVRTYLPEPDLGKVKPGATAQIRTDSFPGKVYEGWVGSISPTAEFTPKNVETPELRTRLVYQVRVFACNPQFELRLGMPATVTIDLDQAVEPDAVLTPEQRCPPAEPPAQ